MSTNPNPTTTTTTASQNPRFASPAAERAALLDFARNNSIAPTHINPGENGTLPAMDRTGYGIQSMVWGGPMQTGPGPALPSGHGAARLAADLPQAARWDSRVANQTDGPRDRLDALEMRDEIKRREEEDRKGKMGRRLKERLRAMVKRRDNAGFGHGRAEVLGMEGRGL